MWFPRQGSCRGLLPSNPHLILDILCLHKDLHATMEVPPEPCPNVVDGVGDRGFEGGSLRWCGRAAPVRGLPGLLRLPQQGSCRGNLLRPSALCGLGLGVALVILGFGLTLAHLPCSAWCDRWRGSDCPCTGEGVQKTHPSFCTPTGVGCKVLYCLCRY